MKPIISYYQIAVTIVISLVLSSGISAQWMQTSGPVGGDVFNSLSIGSNLYVGGQGGVYITTNNGVSWQNRSNGLPADKKVYGLTVKNNILFAATLGEGIYKSADYGLNWTYSGGGITNPLMMSIHAHGNYLFTTTFQTGLYRSADDGATWQKNNDFGGSLGFASLGSTLYTIPHLAGVMKTTDNGNSWTFVNNGLTDIDGECIYTDGTNLYVGTLGGKFFKSTNGGDTWVSYSDGLVNNNWIGDIIINSGKLFAGCMRGLYTSTNGGLNWAADPFFDQVSVVEFNKSGSVLIAGTFARGIYTSSDNGVTWKQSNEGLVNVEVDAIGQFYGRIFAGCYGGRVSSSGDFGAHWSDPGSGIPGGAGVGEFAFYNNTLYAGAGYGVYATTDMGSTWNSVWHPAIYSFAIKVQGNIFFQGSENGIFRSTDAGLTWTNALPGYSIRAIELSGNNVYAGAYSNSAPGMFLSTDNGTNYVPVNNGMPSGMVINSILANNNRVYAGLSYNGVYVTTDNGGSWTQINNGLSNLNVRKLYAQGNTIFAATKGGIFSSDNNGTSWINISGGLISNFSVSSLLKIGTDLYAGTSNYGVWKRSFANMMPNYQISGRVTYKDNGQAVPAGGFVKALYYDPDFKKIYVVDSAGIGPNGIYLLTSTYQENLYIMVYQDDDLLQFIPTYTPGTIDWVNASVVQPQGNLSNMNVEVDRISNTPNAYSISGKVLYNGQGLDNAVLYAKSGNVYKNYGVSNADGNYIVTKLPSGTFTLLVYRIGFGTQSLTVTIDNSSIQNLNINMNNFVGNSNETSNIPQSYDIYQNYPNPFNPVTNIRFDLPVDSKVKLTVFDILGREIEVLVNHKLNAGSHIVHWNAANYSSGIYFYRIESGEFTSTMKMVLLK